MERKHVETASELISESKLPGRVILYGAGWAGKSIYEYLRNKKVPVTAFAVTEQTGNREIEGLPVHSIDKLLKRYRQEELRIFLTVTELNQKVLEEELSKRNIDSYVVISDSILYEITRENQATAAEKAEQAKNVSNTSNTQKTVGYLTPGYLNTDYAERRLIMDKIKDVSYVVIPKETARIEDLMDIEDAEDIKDDVSQQGKRNDGVKRRRELAEACYCPDRYVPEVGMIHTFNMVCSTSLPWCASFETTIPRMSVQTDAEETYFRKLLSGMMQQNCRALYALSQSAYDIQKFSLGAWLSEEEKAILMEKTQVLHPPQSVLITEERLRKKQTLQKIHFLFIGRGFFFKGGREVVDVLTEFEDRYDFELTLISSLQYNDYFTKTSYEEMVKYRKQILEKQWIHFYESLPNEMVLEKCKEAMVGLLPSFGDTYGYVVLEMQAAGCPVVTTNIRAFPEINPEECGWTCQLPTDELGFCEAEDLEELSGQLKEELRRCFQEIFEHPETIYEKGRKSLERIRNMHDPQKYQKELRKILFS